MFLAGQAASVAAMPHVVWQPAPRFVEAAAALTLEFERDTLAAVLVSTRAQYRTPFEIVGDAGVIRADDALNAEHPIKIEVWRGEELAAQETVSNQLAYAKQVDAFAAAVEGREAFPVPGEEGWKNQLILDAAYRSMISRKSEEVQTDQLSGLRSPI